MNGAELRALSSEPLGNTLRRNLAIAVCVGAGLALQKGQLALVVPFSLLALWFSLGGHYLELVYLRAVRPRLPSSRSARVPARFAFWFFGGTLLFVCMALCARVLPIRVPRIGWWWLGGVGFIGIELIAHAVLAVRGAPNFYRGDA